MVWEVLDGAAPSRPVEVGGWFADQCGHLISGNVLLDGHAARCAAFDTGDPAQGVVLHEGLESAELPHGTLHGTGLPDAFVLFDRFDKQTSLSQSPGEGFFPIHVHSGIEGGDADGGVHVVWRGEHDGVETGMFEKVFVMWVGLAVLVLVLFIHFGFEAAHLVGIHITHGNDPHPGDTEKIDHVAPALSATSNDADGDFIVGRFRLGAQPGHWCKT